MVKSIELVEWHDAQLVEELQDRQGLLVVIGYAIYEISPEGSSKAYVGVRQTPLDEWVLKNRIVGGSTPYPGQWPHRNAPLSREPMRACSGAGVQQISIVTPTPRLKSEFLIDMARHFLSRPFVWA